MLSWLLQLAGFCLLLFALLSGALYLFQDALIFHPQGLPDEARQRYHKYELSLAVDGAIVKGWYLPSATPANNPLVIYYGGNGEEISWNLPHFQRHFQASLLLVNYRGYGDSTGKPSEPALKADALALYDHIHAVTGASGRHTVLLGRSLGSGVATYVASQRPVAALVLVTAYDSLTAVAAGHYPGLPIRSLIRHRFESDRLAAQINAPLLSLVAGRDRVVPPIHAERLAAHWRGAVTELRFDRADHINISDDPRYWQAIAEFIQSHAAPPSLPPPSQAR